MRTWLLLLLAPGCKPAPLDDVGENDDTAGDYADYGAAGAPAEITREECRAALDALGVSYTEFDEEGIAAGVRLEDVGSGIDLYYTDEQAPGTNGVLRTACPTAISLAGAALSVRECGVDLRSIGHLGSIQARSVAGTDIASAHTWGGAVDVSALMVGNTTHVVEESFDFDAGTYTVEEMSLMNDALTAAFDLVLEPDYDPRHHNHFHAENTLGWSGASAAAVRCPTGGDCVCEDTSNVGLQANGSETLRTAFVEAYDRSADRIGCAFDAGGSEYVHDVRGVYLQDFRQAEPDCPADGSDGESAIIYNSGSAWRIHSGFWGVYKCIIVDGEANGGAVLLGAPRNEEYEDETTHTTTQDFDRGYMWFDDDDDTVHLHLDEYTAVDYDEVSACVGTVVVENPPGPDSIVVTYPDGGESFSLGDTITLTWESEDTSGSVNVRFHKGPNLDGTDPIVARVGEPLPDTGRYEDMTFYGDDFTPGQEDYYLCVSDEDDSPWDCGGHFSIARDTSYPDDDSDGYDADEDCDDSDASINPGETEVVGDGLDQDCDGSETCYDDDDNDGYLDTSRDTRVSSDEDCSDSYEGRSTDSTTDCDDTDAAISPADAEACSDGVDNDCDGSTDEGCGSTSTDADGDGYDTSTDCDDADSSINPGEAEVVGDAIDQDCDGSETCYDDDDNDGYLDTTRDTRVSSDEDCSDAYEGRSTDSTTDCDDTDASVSPADAEVCSDSVDNDCDGSTDEGCGTSVDVDSDGFDDTTEDMLVADGATVCWKSDMIGWSGDVWIVGYGFGGSSDWTDLTHEAYADGDFYCYDFSDGLYRTNAWDGSGSSSYTNWAYLELYCNYYSDPLCFENTPAQGGGLSVCFIVSGGVVSEAADALCEAT